MRYSGNHRSSAAPTPNRRATATALALALVVPALLVAAAPRAEGASIVTEDFETFPPPGWTVSGTGVAHDEAVGLPAPSLQQNPGQGAHAMSRVHKAVEVPLSKRVTINYWFRGSNVNGDTDSLFLVTLNGGAGDIAFEFTAPATQGNNGMFFQGAAKSNGVYASWPSANAWYRSELTFEDGKVQARAYTETGGLLGTSILAPLPAAATAITKIELRSVFWGGKSVAFWFDALSVDVPCEDPTVSLAADPVSGITPLDVTFAMTATAGAPCVVTAFELDFGDGSEPLVGVAPPAAHVHEYSEAGSFTARFFVMQLGGASATVTVLIKVVLPPNEPPVVDLVVQTPEAPQSHPLGDPLRHDEVTVSAAVSDPQGLENVALVQICHAKNGLDELCEPMSDGGAGNYAHTFPKACAGDSVMYRIHVVDAGWNGYPPLEAWSEMRSFTYEGDALLNVGCHLGFDPS